jgi:uncharacterized protein YgbK (DUF1537 family)
VQLDWPPEWELLSEVLSLTIESRDIWEAEAATRMQEIARQIAAINYRHLFKKIDSVFRGNTFTEIAECIKRIPHDLAIFAPAFPPLGRSVMNSALQKKDVSGEYALDLVATLNAAGLTPKCIATTDIKNIQATDRFVLCDSESADDLMDIERLRVDGEFSPGIPMTVAIGAPLNGPTLILKSGGSGKEDLLRTIAQRFATKHVRST